MSEFEDKIIKEKIKRIKVRRRKLKSDIPQSCQVCFYNVRTTSPDVLAKTCVAFMVGSHTMRKGKEKLKIPFVAVQEHTKCSLFANNEKSDKN